jgi:hypothetical protein
MNEQSPDPPVREAASVVMLRDGPAGLEVFLLKRHGLSEVLAGAYVFPGGKVDLEDARFDTEAHLDMRAAALRAALGEPEIDELQAVALYVAALRVPAGQVPRHDDHEAIDSMWLTPRAALQQYWDGRIELAPPQIMSLAHLARHPSVASALSQARSRPPPLVVPEPFEHDGMRMVCYPGDERHPVRERALPGPTRLSYRNRRFEPAGGLDALFAEP